MRVATYNIKHCDLKGGAAVLATLRALDADLIGLQEVDAGVRRSGAIDQARQFATALGAHHAFGASFALEGGKYGLAALSRWPIRGAESIPLPFVGEARSLLLATVDHPQGELLFAVTHLGLDPSERADQAAAIAARLRGVRRVILVGDFNAGHAEAALAPLHGLLVNAATFLGRAPLRTYPAHAPTIGIDHVFVGPDLPPPRDVRTLPSAASDHLPVVAELG